MKPKYKVVFRFEFSGHYLSSSTGFEGFFSPFLKKAGLQYSTFFFFFAMKAVAIKGVGKDQVRNRNIFITTFSKEIESNKELAEPLRM